MERLEEDSGEEQWALHRYRYELAAQFCRLDDTVVDAACGIGYGKFILPGKWVGVDIWDDEKTTGVIHADLRSWVPTFDFDVFVGLETIEHIDPLEAYVDAAKQARKFIIISTPIIPTTHFNPHHVHDFTVRSLERLFDDWDIVHYEGQRDPILMGDTYGIWVFGR